MSTSLNRRSVTKTQVLLQQTVPSPQILAAQITEGSRIFRPDLVVTVLQDFIGHSQNKFSEMQEEAQKEGTIVSVVHVDVWIVSMTQIFTGNKVCCGPRGKLYADHYSRKLLEVIIQFLGTIRGFVKFWEPDELNTIEEYGPIERINFTIIQMYP